jgi:hypothetical protein
MPDDISHSKRDLVARVATLELLVADLVHALWRVDPEGMGKLAAEAAHDADIQYTRLSLPVPDHQRERLHSVLETRRRMLKRKPADG